MHAPMMEGAAGAALGSSVGPGVAAAPGIPAPGPTSGLGAEINSPLQPPGGSGTLGAPGPITPAARMSPASDFGPSPSVGLAPLPKIPDAGVTPLPKVEGPRALKTEAPDSPHPEGVGVKEPSNDAAEPLKQEAGAHTHNLEAEKGGLEHTRHLERSLGPHRGENHPVHQDQVQKTSENLKDLSTPKGQFKNPAWRLAQDVLSNPVLMAAAAGIAGYAFRGGKGGLIGAAVGLGLSFAADYGFKQMKK